MVDTYVFHDVGRLAAGAALPVRSNGLISPMTFSGICTDRGHAAGQIARLIADRLDAKLAGPNVVLSRLTTGSVSPDIAERLVHLTHAIVGSGGTLALPKTSS